MCIRDRSYGEWERKRERCLCNTFYKQSLTMYEFWSPRHALPSWRRSFNSSTRPSELYSIFLEVRNISQFECGFLTSTLCVCVCVLYLLCWFFRRCPSSSFFSSIRRSVEQENPGAHRRTYEIREKGRQHLALSQHYNVTGHNIESDTRKPLPSSLWDP